MRGLIRSRDAVKGLLIKKVRIPIVDKTVSLTDPGGAAAYGSAIIWTIPKGYVCILGAVLNVQLSSVAAAVADNFDGDFAMGRLANANSTLSANEVEIIQATAFPSAASSKTTAMMRGITAQTDSGKTIPNPNGNLLAYLNVLVDDGSISASADLKANGELYVCYSLLA